MSDHEKRHIVVTGGAGFIGSHTVGALLQRGHEVTVVDDFSTGKRENLAAWADAPRLRVIEADVAEGLEGPLRSVPSVYGIIHLAAQVSVVRSLEAPAEDARTNYLATVQVVQYARQCGVASVVFSSSSAVYGDAAELPVTEATPPAPLSPYGVHKRASELLLGYAQQIHGLRTTVMRLFNVYGPRQDSSSPYSGVISIFLDQASRDEPLTIFGDGEQTRDFVFVGDVAGALVDACLRTDPDGVLANIGTGTATSINDLARACQRCAKSQATVRHEPERPGEIKHSVADVSRARETLGFTPQVALAEGLQRTAEWYREV